MEERHVQAHGWTGPPPPRIAPGPRVALKQLWTLLPDPARHKTLQSLAAILIKKLIQPPGGQEVRHDRP